MPFSHVDTWVFDLDETLYPPATPLFPQIEARMTRWIVAELGVTPEEADALRTWWWHDHGTTLAGLMREHGTDPAPFLRDVHDIDMGILAPDPALRAAIAALPGRRIVFTNGTRPYALRVLQALGLEALWDAVYGIEEAGFVSKPDAAAYAAVFGADGLDPRRAAMVEDTARNLLVPHELGVVTVQVGPTRAHGAHVHHHAPDLTAFLRGAVEARPALP